MSNKMKGLISWATEAPEWDPDGAPRIFDSSQEILQGLRREFKPSMRMGEEGRREGGLGFGYWRVSKSPTKMEFTIRGWITHLKGRRAVGVHITEAMNSLEKAFLELYPPFGVTFNPPSFNPWNPGSLKASPKSPMVDYSLTRVFDARIFHATGGWDAFHRLISRAEKILGREALLLERKKLWTEAGKKSEALFSFPNHAATYISEITFNNSPV